MTQHHVSTLIVGGLLLTGAALPLCALAQSQASTVSALSALPVASVVGGASVVAGAALSASTASVILAASGAVFVIRAVEASARGTRSTCWTPKKPAPAPKWWY